MECTKKIAYVGSTKKLICRDGNKQYADSMGLDFLSYDDLWTEKIKGYTHFIIDIAVGWTSPEDVDEIESWVVRHLHTPIYVRLVDQFKHQKDELTYLLMRRLVLNYKLKVIGTYDADYYGLPVVATIPYPYLIEDENYGSDDRINKMILTGASVSGIYPLREYLRSKKFDGIVDVSHPGYSGSGWDKGYTGKEYLKLLGKYRFMLVTTCTEKYELLKYVECAEAFCVPVGEVPKSLEGTPIADLIIKLDTTATQEDIDRILNLDHKEVELKASMFRDLMKKFRNKEDLINKLIYSI